MAYVDTFTISDVPVICSGSGTHDWISADFKIVAIPNITNTAYTVQIYARIDANGYMEWDGTSKIVASCNGKVVSANVSLAMYNGSEGALTKWDGPATFALGSADVANLTFSYITLDLTTTTGTNGLPGVYHITDGGNMEKFTVSNYTIKIGDGGLKPLLNAPVISELTNASPFNNVSSVSSFTDRISLSWTSDIVVTGSYYRINGGAWQTINTTNTKIIIYDRTPGTSYNLDVYSINGAGSSNTLSTTIRTRHSLPVVSLAFSSKGVDTLTYTWKSDKELQSAEYKMGTNGSWTPLIASGTSGSFTIGDLEPNTKYTVYFRGKSTSTYDDLISEEVYHSDTTHNIAQFVSVENLIFGETILVNINHPSDRAINLEIYVTGNGRIFQTNVNVVNGLNRITFDQSTLDSIYKCFSDTNYVTTTLTLGTADKNGWFDSYTDILNTRLQLTGIAKTAHINVNGNKRAQAFLGINNIPRRAVFWVGDENNKPRRCI